MYDLEYSYPIIQFHGNFLLKYLIVSCLQMLTL